MSGGEYSIMARPLPNMICGDGQIESVGKHVKKLGCSRAFVVSDPGLKAAGVLDRVTSLLEAASIEVVVFPEVPANPTFDCVAAGIAKLAGRFENTAVLSLGGGSSMDAAKAMAVIGPQCGSVDNTMVDAWTADLCKAIGDYTFSGCTGITDLQLPSSVTAIGVFLLTRSGLAATASFCASRQAPTPGGVVV